MVAEFSTKTFTIDSILAKATANLANLASLYQNGTIRLKREIIGSMYSEKLCFDGTEHRTTRLNESNRLMYQISNE